MRACILVLRLCAILTTLVVLVSCATVPSAEERASADYGAEPTAVELLAAAERAVKLLLKDPDSARFRHPGFAKKGGFSRFGQPTLWGYWVCGFVNAKNSFGGYAGLKHYFVMYNNGNVTAVDIASRDSYGPASKCQKASNTLGTFEPGDVVLRDAS